MCGKFVQRVDWSEADWLEALAGGADTVTVTPMRFAQVLVWLDGRAVVRPMRWGSAKRGAVSPGNAPDHIHARAETIDTLPTFADAFARRRGLLLVESFNEGEEITPRKTRQYVITPNDRRPLGIAVIWERWEHAEGAALETFVMVTTPPNALVGTITDRMPAIIRPEDQELWLAGQDLVAVKALLVPVEGDWSMAPEMKAPPPKKPAMPGLFD